MNTDKQTASDGERSALSASERHESIATLIESAGRVEVTDLAARLNVSEETIRRDLRALENDGRLTRAHGGAVRPATTARSVALPDESDRAFFERVALEVPSNGAVYLDGDGFLDPLIGLLPQDTELTVITPLLDLAIATSLHPGIEIVSLGGEVSATGSQSGEWARMTLSDLRVDLVIIFAEGCTEAGDLLASPADALLRRAALDGAQRTVLALSAGASDPQHFTVFANVSDFDVVIASADAAATARALRDDAVIVAAASPTQS